MASNHGAATRSADRAARSREGLHMRPLNVEKGSQRFSRADDTFPPQTATWRNNLLALSQRRNLLFGAYSHQIYVWEPAGTVQTLGSKPEMIINPVMKDPHSGGYISPTTPHAINNILVDDLGRDEVLLLVTDSGNVCGYRVEAIFSALRRAARNKEKRPFDGAQVDPFFVEYVEASAWGLAIHKFARLIAVSANTGLVTVFAFALVNPASGRGRDLDGDSDEENDFNDYGQTWLDIKSDENMQQLRNLMPSKRRTRNIKLTYTGHFSNIPSISFMNSSLDPNGSWMVSTDIDNKLLVWNVWESLAPWNFFNFNDVTFKSFPETLRNDERGWSVLALDPRTFHLLKSPEEACGGHPQRRVKNGQTILDLTKVNSEIPNASPLYNYFPPAVKTEPEKPVLPDIFGADCCINKNHSDVRSTAYDEPYDGSSGGSSFSGETQPAGSHTATSSTHPTDAVDSLSRRAVNGSVYEGTMSRTSSTDEDHDMDTQQASGQGTIGNQLLQSLDENALHMENTPLPHGHGPLTTPEFLQFALLEALGGDVPGVEEYFDNYSAIDEDYSDEEMDDAADDDDDDDDEEDEDDEVSEQDTGNASRSGAVAYQVFDRMYRRAFPGDSGFYGQAETLISLPPASVPMTSNFPILHFSQTDIRLIPHPFANHPSVVCGSPLRQPFTHPIVSIRACDRFNMVKYVPEHGIIVAASQKGRAAIIALTESEETGLSFRIDWIVPFESQEKYGERPLIPLLGMAVSPMQGFEMPPDVPYIPRNTDANDLAFRYKSLNDDAESQRHREEKSETPAAPSKHRPQQHATPIPDEQPHYQIQGHSPSSISTSSSPSASRPGSNTAPLTLPELHARATSAYQPEESWRGWNPSRHYRVLLMYADHTVMSYEFWYDWAKTGTSGANYNDDEDDILVV